MKQGGMKACIYLVLFAASLMFIAVWPLMHVFPPFDPALPAAEVAGRYRDNATGFIAGGILLMISSILVLPFFGVIAAFMKRIEGEHSVLTWAFIALTGFTWVTFFLVGLTFTLAAYRPEASDETIRTISDYNFMMLVVPGVLFCGLTGFLGTVILGDGRAPPVLPRWLGYFQFFICVLTLPAVVVALFKSGPFAWNGALAFWMPTVMFGIWIMATVWALLDAIGRNALAAE